VQLTRDFVPVIFHDFSLSESGTDVPIHDLTFEQVSILTMTRGSQGSLWKFMHASKLQFPREHSHWRHGDGSTKCSPEHQVRYRHRSRSLTTTHIQEIDQVLDRMRYTVDVKNKGFKPNTRGSFIQGPFTTLKELLVKLPDSINFNVEISMSLSPISSFPVLWLELTRTRISETPRSD
jgi:glycerophosphodiester phosphodiesterase